MSSQVPPSLERFGDDLHRAAGRELRAVQSRERSRVRPHGPRLLAGGTLGLAGVAAAIVVGLSATSATPPAFAVVRSHDGSLSVQINRRSGIAGANRSLAAMGLQEHAVFIGDDRSIPGDCKPAGSVPTITIQAPGSARRHMDLARAVRTSGRVSVLMCEGRPGQTRRQRAVTSGGT